MDRAGSGKAGPALILGAALLGLGLGAYAIERIIPRRPMLRGRVIYRDGDYEIRDYPAFHALEMSLYGGREDALQRAFERVSGADRDGERPAALLDPVMQSRRSNAADGDDTGFTHGRWSVRVPLSAARAADCGFESVDPRLRVISVPAQRVAVLRFTSTEDVAFGINRVMLEDFVEDEGLEAEGPVFYAYYGLSRALPFGRQHEVLLPVSP
ncbi:heme-binding protein [Afifella marina]|uniref:heme-binding protein n=1 Tax=Afifella marina TaxID=1080 RepID=UPI0011140E40|nr:heme-binding protein [Afifella marina]